MVKGIGSRLKVSLGPVAFSVRGFGLQCVAILLLLLFGYSRLWAEPVPISHRYSFEKFIPPNGSNFENVYDIEEGQDSSLWFASWGSGIGKLREADWRLYSDNTEGGLPSNFVRCIFYDDKRDVLWAATSRGVAVIAGDQVIQIVIPDAFEPASIRVLGDDEVWIGSLFGDVITCHLQEDYLVSPPEWSRALEGGGKDSFAVNDIVQSSDGSVWVTRNQNGVVRFFDGRVQEYPPSDIGVKRSNDLTVGTANEIILSGADSPAVFSGGRWSQLPSPKGISRTVLGWDDRLFFGTSRGELLIEKEGATEVFWAALDRNNKIRSIVFDEGGRIWIGGKDGVIKGEQKRWLDAGLGPVLEEERFFGNACVASGSVGIVAMNRENQVAMFDAASSDWMALLTLPSQQDSNRRMVLAGANSLWVQNGFFVHEVATSDWRIVRTVEVPTQAKITGLENYGENSVLLSSEEGCFVWGGGEWELIGGEGPVYSISVIPHTKKVAAVRGDGVELWDSGQKVWKWLVPPKHSNKIFNFVEVISSEKFLAGILGLGLYTLEKNQPPEPIANEGLSSARITAAMQAANGDLWVGFESAGLARRTGERWVNYSFEDGLQRAEVVGFLEYPKGQIWGLTEDLGVYQFNPDSECPNTEIVNGPQELSERQSVVFAFRGSDSWSRTHKADLVFSWRIRSVDPLTADESAWFEYSSETSVAIAAPRRSGEYLFEVRAQDREFNTDPSPASVSFSVLPPFWKTLPFLLPLITLTLFAVFLIRRAAAYHIQLRAHHDELDRRVRERTQEVLLTSEQLREEKERLEVTIFSTADAIVAVDTKLRVSLFNEAAETLIGIKRGNAIGRPFESVVLMTDIVTQETICRKFDVGLGARFSGVCIVQQAGREGAEYEYNAAAIRSGSSVTGWVLALRDRSYLKALEHERFRNSKLESLGLVAGGIAHDFNNYLTVVLGNISVAKELSDEGSELHDVLTQSEDASERAASLTKQLLTFAKGGSPLLEKTDISDVIRTAAEFCLRGSPQELKLEIAPNLHFVEVDTGQMTQVIQNIVLNAKQATGSGDLVTITVNNASMEGSGLVGGSSSSRHGVCVSVKDNGKGMSSMELEQVFDPYYTTKPEGSGLGLSVCHSIVAQHGGRISIDSGLGKGTTVNVVIPAVTGDKITVSDEDRGRNNATQVLKSLRFLVLDDQVSVREMLARMLERLGHSVVCVEKGCQAIDLLQSSQGSGSPFDACILDLTVPGSLGGEAVAQALRDQSVGVYTIASSGYSEGRDVDDSGGSIFDDFLPKPYTLDQVRACLEKIL